MRSQPSNGLAYTVAELIGFGDETIDLYRYPDDGLVLSWESTSGQYVRNTCSPASRAKAGDRVTFRASGRTSERSVDYEVHCEPTDWLAMQECENAGLRRLMRGETPDFVIRICASPSGDGKYVGSSLDSDEWLVAGACLSNKGLVAAENEGFRYEVSSSTLQVFDPSGIQIVDQSLDLSPGPPLLTSDFLNGC